MSSASVLAIGVTDLAVLDRCPLRLAFERQRGRAGGQQVGSMRPPLLIGIAIHEALEACARSWPEGHWQEVAARAWEAALSARGVERLDEYPGASVGRARLMRAADRLWQLLEQEGPGATVLPEEPLTSSDGRVVGRADLIIRSPAGTRIVDFKTGSVLDPKVDDVKETYKLQLQTYAVLEHQTSGSWPVEGIIAPLTGPMITIPIVPDECTEVFDQLMAQLDVYEDDPATQEARPAPQTCRWCRHVARCQKFWGEVDPSWSEDVIAIEGHVVAVETAAVGGATMVIIPASGSVEAPRAAVQAEEGMHQALEGVGAGSRVRIAGLRPTRGEATFRLSDSASLAVISG